MKRISLIFMAVLCAMSGAARAQDAATEERFNQLSAKIDVLIEGQNLQRKRIEALEKELSALQQSSKPEASYASQEELKQLVIKVQEIDRKRQEDNELVVKKLDKLAQTLAGSSAARIRTEKTASENSAAAAPSGDVFEYTVQSGDTLSVIVAAYKAKNIKITVDQILKANPGLKPERLHPGQKLVIPAPPKAAE